MIILTVVASILCGILGRMGGSTYGTKWRDCGIPTVATILLWLMGIDNPIALFLTFGLMFGSLTTYWDFIPYNLNKDNFFMHGFAIGLSLVPVAFVTGHWIQFLWAITLFTLWMGLWSKYTKWVLLEEFGRYTIIPIGIFILK